MAWWPGTVSQQKAVSDSVSAPESPPGHQAIAPTTAPTTTAARTTAPIRRVRGRRAGAVLVVEVGVGVSL
ncbi:hypothetical protein KDA82_40230, partial [Streptomyces daliensis]|nr:hypothetical protein [Streptomyces daliensis]